MHSCIFGRELLVGGLEPIKGVATRLMVRFVARRTARNAGWYISKGWPACNRKPPPRGAGVGLYIPNPASVCKVCREKGRRGRSTEAGSGQLAAGRRHGDRETRRQGEGETRRQGDTERKEQSAKRRAQRPAGGGQVAAGRAEFRMSNCECRMSRTQELKRLNKPGKGAAGRRQGDKETRRRGDKGTAGSRLVEWSNSRGVN